MKKIVLGMSTALLLAGCAGDSGVAEQEQYKYTPPTRIATNNTTEVNKPFDLVWARTEKWLTEQGLKVEAQQRESGLLTASLNAHVDGLEYLDCGSGGSRVFIADPDIKVTVLITQSGEQTVATANVKGSTSVSFVEPSGEKIPAPSIVPLCVSRGTLEADLLKTLQD